MARTRKPKAPAPVRFCAAPTPEGGQCRHAVFGPKQRCWQHDDDAWVMVDLNAVEKTDRPVGWRYGDCVLVIETQGARLHCMVHEVDTWQAAEALGARRPCQDIQDTYAPALRSGTWDRLPAVLHALLQHALWQIPEAYRQGGRVSATYFSDNRRQVTDKQVQRWGANSNSVTLGAVAWLEAHTAQPTQWPTNLAAISVKRVLEAGAGPQDLRLYYPRVCQTSMAHEFRLPKPTAQALPWLARRQVDPKSWPGHYYAYPPPARMRALVDAGIDLAQFGKYWTDYIHSSARPVHLIEVAQLRDAAPPDVVRDLMESISPADIDNYWAALPDNVLQRHSGSIFIFNGSPQTQTASTVRLLAQAHKMGLLVDTLRKHVARQPSAQNAWPVARRLLHGALSEWIEIETPRSSQER